MEININSMYNNHHSQFDTDSMAVLEPTNEEIKLMRESLNDVEKTINEFLTDVFQVSSMLIDEVEGTKMGIVISGPAGNTSFKLDVTKGMLKDGTRPMKKDEAKDVGANIAAILVSSMHKQQSKNRNFPAS